MGYLTQDVAGYQLVTPTFEKIGATAMPIDEFTVQNATDAKTVIQVLDEKGQNCGTYYWFNAFEEYPAGWFDVSGLEPAGITLNPGETLLFNSDEENVTATIPGAIK